VASVKIYVKKQIRVDRLNFNQRQMLKLGTVGVAGVIARAQSATNVADSAAKPLSRGYAIRKSKLRGGQKLAGAVGGSRAITNKRDLTLTGSMLGNLKVRTVSENRASAGWSTLKDRQKARNNERLEHFIDFSPRNTAKVVEAAERILGAELVPHLILEKFSG
jgi:hypothetical protein